MSSGRLSGINVIQAALRWGMTATQGRQFDQALAALYGAAMGSREWTEALDRLAGLTRTRCITLDTYDLEQHVGNVIASNVSPHPAIDEYNRGYGQRNLLIETALDRLRPGDAFCASDLAFGNDLTNQGSRATLFRIGTNRLALVITDQTRSADDFRPGLKAHFNLTATQAELVNDLIGGQSLRGFADAHEITYQTARTHLKNAMKKNGWRRQGEMIVRIFAHLYPVSRFHPS